MGGTTYEKIYREWFEVLRHIYKVDSNVIPFCIGKIGLYEMEYHTIVIKVKFIDKPLPDFKVLYTETICSETEISNCYDTKHKCVPFYQVRKCDWYLNTLRMIYYVSHILVNKDIPSIEFKLYCEYDRKSLKLNRVDYIGGYSIFSLREEKFHTVNMCSINRLETEQDLTGCKDILYLNLQGFIQMNGMCAIQLNG